MQEQPNVDWPVCECGCGQPVGAVKQSRPGAKRGQPNRFVVGHAARSWNKAQLEKTPLKARFWARARITPTCWVWTAGTTGAGYGALGPSYGTRYAHRYAYEFLVGPIPDGLVIDHLCRNRVCVNPQHMEPVTHKENLRRGNAEWVARTHCKYGHELTPENTKRGHEPHHRRCRECEREHVRRCRAKKKLQA